MTEGAKAGVIPTITFSFITSVSPCLPQVPSGPKLPTSTIFSRYSSCNTSSLYFSISSISNSTTMPDSNTSNDKFPSSAPANNL